MKNNICSAAHAAMAVLLLSCMIFPAQARADEAERFIQFADHLFTKGEYYRAVTEYERFIFFYPRHPMAARAQLQIGYCLRRGRQTDKAIEAFQAVVKTYPETAQALTALFEIAETYYLSGNYPDALGIFTTIAERHPESGFIDLVRYRIGWCFLMQGMPDAAAAWFSRIAGQNSPDFGRKLAAAAGEYADLPFKSPARAGLLSAVVPGAGQLYSHRPLDALTAFLLNSAFILGGINAFRSGASVVGGMLLFFEAGWYAGSIFNAVSDTHKYNRNIAESFYDNMRYAYPEERLSHAPQSILFLSFTAHF